MLQCVAGGCERDVTGRKGPESCLTLEPVLVLLRQILMLACSWPYIRTETEADFDGCLNNILVLLLEP